MCEAAKEAAWLPGLLEDFGLYLWSPLVILGDNQGLPMLEAYRHPVPLHLRACSSRTTHRQEQRLWWMTRSQSRSLPLLRLIVHSSRVLVPGLLGVQSNQQHSSLDPPFCVGPRTPLSSTTAPNVRAWCLPPVKPLRSVPFLANQVVSLPSLSTYPILAHPFPSHVRHYASIGSRPGLRAEDPLRPTCLS